MNNIFQDNKNNGNSYNEENTSNMNQENNEHTSEMGQNHNDAGTNEYVNRENSMERESDKSIGQTNNNTQPNFVLFEEHNGGFAANQSTERASYPQNSQAETHQYVNPQMMGQQANGTRRGYIPSPSGVMPERKSNQKFPKILKLCSLALAIGAIGGAGFFAVSEGLEEITGNEIGSSKQQVNVVKTTSSVAEDSSGTVADVAENNMPSIVSINVMAQAQYDQYDPFSYWFSQPQEEVPSTGTGFIISQTQTQLMIATNYHVIQDASTVTIGFVDGTSAPAEVKGYDADADVAVVIVDISDLKKGTIDKIKSAVIGDSKAMKVGEQTIAIGNALGYGQSVTSGIVSAKEREVDLEDKVMTLLQTDAAINPGNSGGPLLNGKGEVIGINTVKYSTDAVEGMGFAIPIETAYPIIEEIISAEGVLENSATDAAYLGINGETVTAEMAERYGISEGVHVVSVTADTPAGKAGIRNEDIITAIDGKSVKSIEELQSALRDMKPDDKVKIVYYRQENGNWNKKEANVTLGNRSEIEQQQQQQTPQYPNE